MSGQAVYSTLQAPEHVEIMPDIASRFDIELGGGEFAVSFLIVAPKSAEPWSASGEHVVYDQSTRNELGGTAYFSVLHEGVQYESQPGSLLELDVRDHGKLSGRVNGIVRAEDGKEIQVEGEFEGEHTVTCSPYDEQRGNWPVDEKLESEFCRPLRERFLIDP